MACTMLKMIEYGLQNLEEADKRDGVQQKRKFPQKVMVWLGACSKQLTPLIILDEGTMDHRRYIDEILPVALKYGNEGFGDKIGPSNRMVPSHIRMPQLKNGAG